MAWDTTDLANYNDIVIQDGIFAYNFTASGAIYKGQAVCVCPAHEGYVMQCTSDATYANCIGIAAQNAAAGTQIPVAGPGNIVYAVCDTNSDITAGTAVYGDTNGILDATAGNATKIAAYALSTPEQITTNYVAKFLLV